MDTADRVGRRSNIFPAGIVASQIPASKRVRQDARGTPEIVAGVSKCCVLIGSLASRLLCLKTRSVIPSRALADRPLGNGPSRVPENPTEGSSSVDVDLHHDLAEGAALAHVAQCFGHLLESERAVDVDPDMSGDAEAATGSKCVGPSRTARMPIRRPVSRPIIEADRDDRISVGTDPPTQRYRPPRASARRRRTPSDGRRDRGPVVRLGAAGEVFAEVVNDLVGAKRPHEVELAGVVDSGHVGTARFASWIANDPSHRPPR